MAVRPFPNPFAPGAGHPPPYLAGRERQRAEFRKLLEQDVIRTNLVLTGLRGVGKTVLLESLRPIAREAGWGWAGQDLSESINLSDEKLVVRLLTDLSSATSHIVIDEFVEQAIGFHPIRSRTTQTLDYAILFDLYQRTPGHALDKLKTVLEQAWPFVERAGLRGVVFAYDEAQNLAGRAAKEEFPTSLLLDVFQGLQRKELRYLLVLTGLPTLHPKLVEARTYAERMFNVTFLDRLDEAASRDAIQKPIQDAKCPVRFSESGVKRVFDASAGYPYFIQYICRELFEVYLDAKAQGREPPFPIDEIVRSLDQSFFAGRWANATDRQRDLLRVIARLENCGAEFTVQQIVDRSKAGEVKPFSASHVAQILATLAERGLVYKNRHGRYSFAVPLFDQFIKRREAELIR